MKILNRSKLSIFLYFTLIVVMNCNNIERENGSVEKDNPDSHLFTSLPASRSHVDFKNELTENDSLNYFTYSYIYMGGGVATGDLNNDGLLDLFFTGNQVQNALYINKGSLKFENTAKSAGVSGDDRWYTGVTMADVNSDGFLDIYCSVSGLFNNTENQLFINQGDGTFVEEAKNYGLNDSGNTIQSAFFDYDKDGDLDLYVANYPPTPFKSPVFYYERKMQYIEDIDSDHLYRNDNGVFKDVTKETGIANFGLSIGLTIADLNNDSWPDIYVSNDFSSPDYMYINNGNGTFREVSKQALANTAYYGMGIDIADWNNDALLDIFQVDMDPKNNRRKKANMASMNPQLYWDVVNAGFNHQNMQNTMQMNTGVTIDGNPYFTNVSRITGTSSTDWSWGPLFADFDNDGLKDLFVSNGTRREINNNDYFNSLKEKEKSDLLALSLKIPSEKIDNFIFKNEGNFQFSQANERWNIIKEGFSNGGVYADLDNDGDLEIVLNNLDDTASIFENHASETTNFLKLRFKGAKGNSNGIGVRAFVTNGKQQQLQELTLTRGFQSSVAPEMIFGVGTRDKIQHLKIVWPDGKMQSMVNLDANQMLLIDYDDAMDSETIGDQKLDHQFLTLNDSIVFPNFKHEENIYDDFRDQVLLPHKMSSFGPALAVGDMNGDQKDDYFIGGSKGKVGAIFFQTDHGFLKQDSDVLVADKSSEDVGALLFDADGDGDKDLYVVSGGYEFTANNNSLIDRLYVNDGHGNFTKAKNTSLPDQAISGSKAYHADFNKDGKEDLLVLGRQIPGNYPAPAKSYILMNRSANGKIAFEESKTMQPEGFDQLGMATSAVITDFDGDGWKDFIVVGEWMPVRAFKNNHNGFIEVSEEMGLNIDSTGWWWSIAQGDFDDDGDMDFILGNNGLNYKYKATKDETFDIYVNDFDRDSNDDIVLSYYNEGEQYPLRGRQCSSQQIPGIKKKFKDYESFSQATLENVYTEKSLESALHYQVKSFASVYLENSNGTFIKHELPMEAQLSSINRILVGDYDRDGHIDALIAGNLYASEVETPRNDSGYGLFLKGNGKGKFNPVRTTDSGFFLPGDVKDMDIVTFKDNDYVLAVKNDSPIQVIQINTTKPEIE